MGDKIAFFLRALLESLYENQTKILDIVQTEVGSSGNGSFVNPFVGFGGEIKNYLSNIAIGICGIFFCIEMLKQTLKGDGFKFEDILTTAYKYVLAVACISVGNQFMNALEATAMDVISRSTGSLGGADINALTYGESINKMLDVLESKSKEIGIIDGVLTMGTLLIPMLAIKIVGMVGVVMAYGRLFELTMYSIIYPLPCGALLLDQGRITKRFIAGYGACALQGAFMIISVHLFQFMTVNEIQKITDAITSKGVNEGMGQGAFTLLMASLVMLIGMTKSSTWARRLMGEE